MILRQWSTGRLRKLRKMASAYPLRTVALALDVSPADADLALWALMGRTIEQAATHLNAKKAA